jgi:hypothetical protein
MMAITQDDGWSEDEMQASLNDTVGIVPIADAHLCEDRDDFYRLQSRMTICRLFRRYIELSFRTPTELLYNYNALQKIQAYGSLFSSGVDRVSVLQGKTPGQSQERRRNALHEIVDMVVMQARQSAETIRRRNLRAADLKPLLEDAGLSGRADHLATAVLVDSLIAERSWLGKFNRLARLAGDMDQEGGLALVDPLLADLMCIPASFQDILGFQRHLAQTVCTIVDLCNGVFDENNPDAIESLTLFAPLIAAGRMPQTHAALIERLLRHLRSNQPFDRHDPAQEKEAFQAVALRVKTATGIIGGELTSQALDQRALRLFGPDGAPPSGQNEAAKPRDAVERAVLLSGLADGAACHQDFQAGSCIFREGETADRAYMVLSGSVEICTTYKGGQVMLARLGEGSIFGEMALFNAMPRSANAVTVAGCRLRAIDKNEMENRVAELDSFSRHWVSYLIGRITDLSGRVAESGTGERP